MTDTGHNSSGPRTSPTLAVQLAEHFRAFGVARAYGEPVRLGDETVVPVALVQYGFGGGGGQGYSHGGGEAADEDAPDASESSRQGGEGGGGGGGGIVIPVGVLARGRSGRAVFRPNPLAALLCLAPVLWAGGHAVARVARALRS
jgi:uncharacterized spore protein YtfJ